MHSHEENHCSDGDNEALLIHTMGFSKVVLM